jgi:beta-aspartyl-peptidase (threonine type)
MVHGGAGTFRPELHEDCRAALRKALHRGWSVLESGGASIHACEQAIIELEDEPLFDAGVGSHLNRDGKVQTDAILMDGVTLKSGAVCALERIRNPIRLARCVLDKSDHMLLAGAGAEQFAVENGIPLCDPHDLITRDAFARWSAHVEQVEKFGTVGAVAIDGSGRLAGGTSTGGTFFKYPGRVGDSPLVGCGCYAADAAAVSCTGHGESIMKIVMAKVAADLVESGHDAQSAADAAVRRLMDRTNGAGGLIVVDRMTRVGAAFSTPMMAWGSITEAGLYVHI